jgi:hypothetical protein
MILVDEGEKVAKDRRLIMDGEVLIEKKNSTYISMDQKKNRLLNGLK